MVVTDYPTGEQRPHKFKIAMAIFALTILIALTSKLPVALTLMTGVAGMLLTGVLRMDEAYASINWKTVFMMAGLIPLGWAMDSSGAAAWVAGHTIDKLPTGIPVWVLEVALALLTTAFSLVISHVGATIVMVPIAVNGTGGGRQPDRVRADRGAVGVQQPDDGLQPGDFDDHRPGQLHPARDVAGRRTVVADLHLRGGVDDQPDVLRVGFVGRAAPCTRRINVNVNVNVNVNGWHSVGWRGGSTPCVEPL